MDQVISYFEQSVTFQQLFSTFVALLTLFLLRKVLQKTIQRSKSMNREAKRRSQVNLNSFMTFVFILTLAIIWAKELETLALSFVAIAAAVVIATKELILCLSGGLYKTSSQAFSIGDRIEIEGIRGDVIDKDMLSTKILEIGPGQKTHQYTGRSITIPNSLFLSHPVINESFLDDFVLHTFTIPLANRTDWKKAEKAIMEAAMEECERYLEQAQKYMDRIQRKENLETPKIHPRVHLRLVDHEKMELVARVTVPAPEKGKIEQLIIRKFLEKFPEWLKDH